MRNGVPAVPAKRNKLSGRMRVITCVAIAAGIGAAAYGWHWWNNGRFMENTEDAYVGGDITVIRWSSSSKNLDPLIGSEELMDFCAVVMRTLDAALTPEMLMRALAVRLDLTFEKLEDLQVALTELLRASGARRAMPT